MAVGTLLPKLIFFGDSLTQRGWSAEGGWLTILADTFVRRVDVVGRGFSGYNTRMCLQLLPTLFPDNASVSQCKEFAIFLGANDASLNEQHVDVAEYKSNLIKMVDYLKSIGLPCNRLTLISLPPLDEGKWNAREIAEGKSKNRLLQNCPAYMEAAKQAAQESNTNFVNLYEAMIAQHDWLTFFGDGLHFSSKGAEFLAQLLIPILEDRLNDCPFRLPDWKDVNKADPSETFDRYFQEIKGFQ